MEIVYGEELDGRIRTFLWGWIRKSYYFWLENALKEDRWYITDPAKLMGVPCRKEMRLLVNRENKKAPPEEKEVIVLPKWWNEFEEMRKRDDIKDRAVDKNISGIMLAAHDLFSEK